MNNLITRIQQCSIKTISVKFVLIYSIIFITSNCSPIYYVLSTQSLPELTEKNDLVVGGSYNFINSTISLPGIGTGYGGQIFLAYSPIDNLGIYTGYNNAFDISASAWDSYDFNIGYYDKIDSSFSYNVYLGTSIGNLILIENENAERSQLSSRMLSLSFRPSISYQINSFRLNLSSNLKRLTYSKIEGTPALFNGGQYLQENNNHTLLEPSLSFIYDSKKVDFLVQFGRSINLTNSNFRQHNSYFSIGLNLSIDALKKP